MKYNILTADQIGLLTEEQAVSATQTALMEPVECIDCGTYVPLGWVEFGTVLCPKGKGSNPGIHYGHRVPTEVRTNILDRATNEQIGA